MIVTRRSGRTLVVNSVIALVAVLVVLLVTGFVLRFHGAKRRNDALLALRATNTPSLPSDLKAIADGKPEASAWIARVASLPPTLLARDLATPIACNEAAAECQAFETCLRTANVERAEFSRQLALVLDFGDGTVPLGPCEAVAIRFLAARAAPSVAVARTASDFGSIDPAVVVRALDATPETWWPALPIGQEIRAQDATFLELARACVDERPAEILAALRTLRAVAHVHEHAFLLAGGRLWEVLFEKYLVALELALPHLPRDADVAWIADDLEAVRPRERLAEALVGERTFGNRAFEQGRSRSGPAAELAHSVLPWTLTASADQAEYLDSIDALLAALKEPAFTRHPLPPAPSATWYPLTSTLQPILFQSIEAADHLEARLALARGALVAFREGGQKALPWLAKSVDPYDGKPLRCALSNEGLILLWSVGRDRVDDEGRDRVKDVVWKLRLR